MDSIYWLILLVVLLFIEVITLGLTTIWFAAGALGAFFVSIFISNLLVQILVFSVISFLLLFFTRPIAMKYFEQNRTKTNYESLIGKVGRVIERIDNIEQTGQVNLNGQEWTARSTNDEVTLEKGVAVSVKNISGVKLIVEEKMEGVE